MESVATENLERAETEMEEGSASADDGQTVEKIKDETTEMKVDTAEIKDEIETQSQTFAEEFISHFEEEKPSLFADASKLPETMQLDSDSAVTASSSCKGEIESSTEAVWNPEQYHLEIEHFDEVKTDSFVTTEKEETFANYVNTENPESMKETAPIPESEKILEQDRLIELKTKPSPITDVNEEVQSACNDNQYEESLNAPESVESTEHEQLPEDSLRDLETSEPDFSSLVDMNEAEMTFQLLCNDNSGPGETGNVTKKEVFTEYEQHPGTSLMEVKTETELQLEEYPEKSPGETQTTEPEHDSSSIVDANEAVLQRVRDKTGFEETENANESEGFTEHEYYPESSPSPMDVQIEIEPEVSSSENENESMPSTQQVDDTIGSEETENVTDAVELPEYKHHPEYNLVEGQTEPEPPTLEDTEEVMPTLTPVWDVKTRYEDSERVAESTQVPKGIPEKNPIAGATKFESTILSLKEEEMPVLRPIYTDRSSPSSCDSVSISSSCSSVMWVDNPPIDSDEFRNEVIRAVDLFKNPDTPGPALQLSFINATTRINPVGDAKMLVWRIVLFPNIFRFPFNFSYKDFLLILFRFVDPTRDLVCLSDTSWTS